MRAKKLTLAQKKLIKTHGLDWETWNVLKEDTDTMVLVSKKSGRKRTIRK